MPGYPKVHGEFETLAKIMEGNSIIRYGDGEMGVMLNKGYTRNKLDLHLSKELRVHMEKCDTALIGIPTMDPRGDKYENWKRHIDNYGPRIPRHREYYSAFITRPDCAPWLRTREYVEAIQALWLDRNVLLIGPEPHRNKIRKAIELTQEIEMVECPLYQAYDQIDEFEQICLKSSADLILLSCGVTATCLAARVSKHKQAIDIGSIGGFMVSQLFGEKHGRYY